MKTLTENLKEWRKDRNITNANYYSFVGNILEELLEPLYEISDREWAKRAINEDVGSILRNYFDFDITPTEDAIIDAIQDIQVFCINETELMGYDNIKCNKEVFKHINCRKQDPQQFAEWQKYGASGKWQKSLLPEHIEKGYKADYNKCKLLT